MKTYHATQVVALIESLHFDCVSLEDGVNLAYGELIFCLDDGSNIIASFNVSSQDWNLTTSEADSD